MPVTQINPNNSGVIEFGPTATATDASCQATNVILRPVTNSTSRAGTYCAPPANVPGRSSWELQFDYLQDWGAVGSVSQFLADNDGQLVEFTFHPTDPTVPTASGMVYALAGSYGGAPGEAWVHSGVLPVDGVPTFTAPVATGADVDVDDDRVAV